MTAMPPSEIESRVEAKLHEKGTASAKELTEWLVLPEQREVIVALNRLKELGVIELVPSKDAVPRWKMKEQP